LEYEPASRVYDDFHQIPAKPFITACIFPWEYSHESTSLERREAELIRRARGWLLVYGRRKIGKTFLLRREVAWDL
jgi:hypothetical protein